jgi:hypothetical protein
MDLAKGFDRDVSTNERWRNMKKLALIALLVCMSAVVGCGGGKTGGSGSGTPTPTGSSS